MRMADLTQREGITLVLAKLACKCMAICALKRECITHFGLNRNFFFEFLQVFAAQCELYLWELDGDFNSIHVCVMHDACGGSSVIEWRCALRKHQAMKLATNKSQILQLTETAFLRLRC